MPLRAPVVHLLVGSRRAMVVSGRLVGRDRRSSRRRPRRPYIGGSQDNSVLNLIFGYNGFGRLTGNEPAASGGGRRRRRQWGPTGWAALFNVDLRRPDLAGCCRPRCILLVAGLWFTPRARRAPTARAPRSCSGAAGSLVTGVVFSFAPGIIHPYYTVALAPAIGALVGIGSVLLVAAGCAPVDTALPRRALVATGVWAASCSGAARFLPWLGAVVAAPAIGSPRSRWWRSRSSAAL